jgi:hypothetical protein
MNKLSAENDRGVVEALFRSVEEISDENMARPIGPLLARPGRRRAHGCAPRDSGEVQARLKPEQTAKINMPVVLPTGQESTDPSKAQVGPVAAALPDAHRLALARQQHIANILDPETFTKHLLGVPARPDLALRTGYHRRS